MDMEEARAKSGHFGYFINADGVRDPYPLQWGEPFMRSTHFGDVPCIKWCNGVSEGWRRLDGLRIEWI